MKLGVIREEVFSSWDAYNIGDWYEKKSRKTVMTFEQCVDNVDVELLNDTEDDTEKDDYKKKIALYLWGSDVDKGIIFINKWRSNQHNLKTALERKHMIDLCIIWLDNIMSVL